MKVNFQILIAMRAKVRKGYKDERFNYLCCNKLI